MVIRYVVMFLCGWSFFVQANTLSMQSVEASDGDLPLTITIELPDGRFYKGQSILFKVKLLSQTPLETLDIVFDDVSHGLLKRLEGPVSEYVGEQVGYQYTYMLTPLTSGPLMLPVMRVYGTWVGQAAGFDQRLTTGAYITISASNEKVNPWLALEQLDIRAKLKRPDTLEIGQALEITYRIEAVGLSGAQLPSLEEQLQGKYFKIYKVSSKNQGHLSKDGQHIRGVKTETYTLVPLFSGRALLPAIQVDWWNTQTHQLEHSRSPMRQFFIDGNELTSDAKANPVIPDQGIIQLWVPILIAFGVLFSLWSMSHLRRKGIGEMVKEEVTMIVICNSRRISFFLAWLAPIRRLQRIRQLLINMLPSSYRLWFCIKLVEHETDPDNWSCMLRFLANKHLGFPAQASLHEMGKRICDCHPGCDTPTMMEMMKQLEASLYGKSTLDFKRWKQDFRRQLKPKWFGLLEQKKIWGDKTKLPPLNPRNED